MRPFNPLKLIGKLLRCLRSPRVSERAGVRLTRGERAGVLIEACLSIHLGRLEEAREMLADGGLETKDAARLNLLGVIHEKRREWRQARQFYGQAIAADWNFAPAQQNLRRWFELFTLGSSQLPLLLGDEGPEWWSERTPPAPPPGNRVSRIWGQIPANQGNYYDN